jgi:hypothetical protein
MKNPRLETFAMMVVLAVATAGLGQTAPAATGSANAPVYTNENQSDPAPLKLNAVAGRVRGLGGDAMSRASVSLFTEDGHAFIATVVSDKDGKFRFDKVDKGLYRIVARVDGLCTANIPIKVEPSLLHRKLEITMQPKGLDTCSYGMAK